MTSVRSTASDAVVVGSGPNGLAAAIVLARAGLSVLLIERERDIGGGARTESLTIPGFLHDVCSAVHPLAAASPFYTTLPLAEHGLEWIEPPLALAHPFDDRPATLLERDLGATMTALQSDGDAYRRLVEPLSLRWDDFARDALAPLHIPEHPLLLARFGLRGLQSIQRLAHARLRTTGARALLAGIAAHAMQPLTRAGTAAIALVLAAAAHRVGWPIARGGSASLANALASYFVSIGGRIETGWRIGSLPELPPARAVLLDMTPKQLLQLDGAAWSPRYHRALSRFRYGPGVFKVDWALSAPVPWRSPECARAGTVHLGGSMEEIAESERAMSRGEHPLRPFVLLSQPSLFDATRAPARQHTLWAYCHVPSGSTVDMLPRIEAQIERFAPGFRDVVLARHTMNTAQIEAHDPNFVGGDIGQGANTLRQLFFRPVVRWNPYATSRTGVYLCSASTPPGGGVHGMCGYHAARSALRQVFGVA